MKIITKKQIEQEKEFYFSEIKKGKIFIYPTDTIYGIGCNALNSKAILKIREIKNREAKPFSIIAPSKEWIKENCEINKKAKEWLKKLPGPYTLILNLKNKKAIANETNNDAETLGVRIPANWFAELISKITIPFITTSVNISGESPITSLQDLRGEIKKSVDYFIDDEKLNNPPSQVIDLTKEKEKILR